MMLHTTAMKVPLREIAHARSGDDGGTPSIGLIALRPEYYPILKKQVTVERILKLFEDVRFGAIERFENPRLGALSFLLHASTPPRRPYGATLLRMEIDVDSVPG